MMAKFVLVGFLVILYVTSTQGEGCGRIVCYHTNWSQYRPEDGKFFPDNIDPSLCTHMIYAFAKLSGNHLAPFEWNDDDSAWSTGLFSKFQSLKQRNPGVKTLLAVGGWNLGSAPFTQIVQSASHRRDFITHSIQFLRQRNFDGLDLDWEYPANRGSPAEDRRHFVEFVQELKQAFVSEGASSGKPRLLLTAAVGAGKDKIDTAYDVPAISRELDFINVMSYDLHGSWESVTGHHSPLFARSGETGDDRYLNLDFAAQYWVQKGADRNKLNIGMGLYGRSFTLSSPLNSGIGAPTTKAGDAGHYTREAGFLSYYEICDMQNSGGQVGYISEQRVPYIHKGNQWIGFDNPDSLRDKVRYVKQNGFGGVMVWALPLDDFSGQHCGQGPFPLLHAIHSECQHSTGTLSTPAPGQVIITSTSHHVGVSHTAPPGVPTTTKPPHTIEQTDEYTCSGQDGFYPSPYSCREYIICVSHVSYTVNCADGLVFNPHTRFCDWPQHYRCTIGDAPSGVQTIAPMTTFRPYVYTTRPPVYHTNWPVVHTSRPSMSSYTNNFCHGRADDVYGDPTDCAYFIECVNGHGYRQSCATGTVWDDVIQTCDRLDNVPGCDHGAP